MRSDLGPVWGTGAMIDRVFRRLVAVLLLSGAMQACSPIPPDPLSIDGPILTVNNTSSQEWQGVELWINRYYRATTPSIAAGSRFQAPLGVFVDGYGRTFAYQHQLIRDVRLSAKASDGTPVALTMAMKKSGLDALQRKP
jgi:hypothetical protein